jgi:threonine dehydrogenase-like Zn-dependent dehydrogenase
VAKLPSISSFPQDTYSALEFVAKNTMQVVRKSRQKLSKEQVRLQVVATGICGSDLHGISGENGRREVGQVMGHETCGIVVEVGDPSRNGLVGQFGALNPVVSCGECRWCAGGQEQVCEEVWIIGVVPSFDAAFGEEVVIPASSFVPLGGMEDPVLGALIEPLAVGFHAAHQADIDASSKVLVIGAGPIGQASALAARYRGASSITVIEPNPFRAEVVEGLGFSVFTPDSFWGAPPSSINGRPTVVIDAVGSSSTLNSAIEASDARSSIVLVGMGMPQVTLPAYSISTRERRIFGSYCYSAHSFGQAADWLRLNNLTASKMIDVRTSIEDAPLVFEELLSSNAQINKAVIVP